MGTSRRKLKEIRAAFAEQGLDVVGFAGLLSQFCHGYRPILVQDRQQSDRCDAMAANGKTRTAARFRPKFGKVVDEETGQEIDVVKIDEKTQLAAMKLAAEILQLKTSGVSVNVNHGVQVGDGSNVATVGEYVALLEGTGHEDLEAVVDGLPGDQRRRMIEVLLKKARSEHAAPTLQQRRKPDDRSQDAG